MENMYGKDTMIEDKPKKRINTKRKGQRLETEIANLLKEKGYQILFKSVFVRFRNIDFGPWDLVACREKTKPHRRILIQCTSWAHRAERRTKCKEWKEKYMLHEETGFLVAKNKEGELIWERI